MAWSAKTDATQLTSITTEQFFSFPTILTVVPLNPGELVDVYVKYVPAGSPTDSLVVSVYGTLDGSVFDIQPVLTFVLDKGTNPNSGSFVVSGLYSFRIGVKRSGTTDTIVSADCSFRRDGVSL